jgi:uncharacterized membrane protein
MGIEKLRLGHVVLGLGIVVMAIVALAWGDFDPGQPVPKSFPERTALAYVVDVFMLVAGAALAWRRSAVWGAAALAIYFGLIVVVVMNGHVLLTHYREYGAYSGPAAQVAIAAAAVIVYAADAGIEPVLAARLTRIGQIVFGVCAVLFGGAHFFYMNLTAPLVPTWLPPSQEFWGYATGIAHIAGGLAIIAGVQARLAAILLTVMYALFTVLVHIPLVLGDPSSQWIWSENAVNIALIGTAWVVADSLAPRSPAS